MATRLYLPSSGSPVISPTASASWSVTSSLQRYPMSPVKQGTTMTSFALTDSNITNQSIAMLQFVSPPCANASISGTYRLQMRALERITSDNLFLAMTIRVIAPDGTTVRGTLLALTLGATEFATSLTNRTINGSVSAVTPNEGDFVVAEIGVSGDPAGLSTGHAGTLRHGDSAASDLASDEASTADNAPWLEFSSNITFLLSPPFRPPQEIYNPFMARHQAA